MAHSQHGQLAPPRSPALPRPDPAAHHDRQAGPTRTGGPVGGGIGPVEALIGVALIVIAAAEIVVIVRTVQSNMRRA